MADFVSAEITQEIIDAKNKLNQQADRATLIVDGWEQAGAGAGMTESMYDPQGIHKDCFARSNMTGEQAISTITGLEVALDSKTSEDDFKTINGVSIVGSGNIVVESGGGGVAGVTSVNGEAGTVILDADNIDETASRIYFTPAEKTKLAGIEANANNYTLPSDVVQDANYVATENSYTAVEKTKLAGIEAGAEVNTVSTADLDAKEDSLGNPTAAGQILSSDTMGVRSWIDAPTGGGGGGSTEVGTITMFELYSTANIATKGEGVYTLTNAGSWQNSELPFRGSSSAPHEYTITIKDLGAGSWHLECIGKNGRSQGTFVKTITPLIDANKTHWSLVPNTRYSSTTADASYCDLRYMDDLVKSFKRGGAVQGMINYSGKPAGGVVDYFTYDIQPLVDGSDGTIQGFLMFAYTKAFNAGATKKRYLSYDTYGDFDSGWLDA